MKILTILGARPQFIKAGSVSREISCQRGMGLDVTEVIVHTGQHYDSNMSDVFFEEMKIPLPNYRLGIGGKSHGAMTGQMIEEIESVIKLEKPDWVLVYGDTNSTLAGAIAASKMHVPIAHVEAGLRSHNMRMPEEVNRILTDRLSTILFCPTRAAELNLLSEGANNWSSKPEINVSGDVMYDGALFYRKLAVMPEFAKNGKKFILCTIHRAENTDNEQRLRSIFLALCEISKTCTVILPLHPRTKKTIIELNIDTSGIEMVEPVGYLNMVWLLENCSMVITDSGGLQKEAYFFGKECVTLRDETEWTELLDLGVNTLTGANAELIVSSYRKNLIKNKWENIDNLYGDGNSSKVIVDRIIGFN